MSERAEVVVPEWLDEAAPCECGQRWCMLVLNEEARWCPACVWVNTIAAHPQFVAMREAAEALDAIAKGDLVARCTVGDLWEVRLSSDSAFDEESWTEDTLTEAAVAVLQRARADS